MIFFGGLEEVGWRYTVQPILEKYMSFTNSSFVISIMWSLWHLPLFFITGMNKGMDFGLFYIGVLGMSFALGAIFHISKSLWLCVLFHALVNAFSQVILVKPDLYINGFSTVIRIVFAALVVYMINRRNCKDHKRIFG